MDSGEALYLKGDIERQDGILDNPHIFVVFKDILLPWRTIPADHLI
jgi:hypothetical protein